MYSTKQYAKTTNISEDGIHLMQWAYLSVVCINIQPNKCVLSFPVSRYLP